MFWVDRKKGRNERREGKQREGFEKRKLKARADMISKSNLNATGSGVYETDFF